MGVFQGVKKAGKLGVASFIESNPVTNAVAGVASALGIGGPSKLRQKGMKRLQEAYKRGDWEFIQRKAAGARYGRVEGTAQQLLAGAPSFAAARQAHVSGQRTSQWQRSNGPAQAVAFPSASGSMPVTRSPRPATSAPAAKKSVAQRKAARSTGPKALPTARPKPPCKYGPRGPDGYCPKKPTARGLAGPAGPRPKPPCKYGPRGPDGYCPKKRRATRAEKAVSQQVGRAATAAGTAAANAARTVIKTVGPGVIVSTIAKASLVLGAGLAAYYLTSQLMKLRYKTYDDLRYQAANAYRESRRAAAAQLGRGLTPQENAELARYFKARMQLLDQYEAAGKPISGVANLTFED